MGQQGGRAAAGQGAWQVAGRGQEGRPKCLSVAEDHGRRWRAARAAQGDEVERRKDGRSRECIGHAAVCDRLSEGLDGFKEQIKPLLFLSWEQTPDSVNRLGPPLYICTTFGGVRCALDHQYSAPLAKICCITLQLPGSRKTAEHQGGQIINTTCKHDISPPF